MLILRRIDNHVNMARFYAMSLETSLFGEVILIRRWGRIGAYGQVRSEWFASPDAAAERMAIIASLKFRRGYDCYFTALDFDGAPALALPFRPVIALGAAGEHRRANDRRCMAAARILSTRPEGCRSC